MTGTFNPFGVGILYLLVYLVLHTRLLLFKSFGLIRDEKVGQAGCTL